MSEPVTKHICIIGHGAIGLLWGHQLAVAGHQVTLISRRQTLPTSKQLFTNNSGTTLANELTFSHQLPQRCDLVLVTTKAYQIHDAITPFITEITAPIMLLHNGMGAVDTLPLAAHQQVMLATTTHGALIDENGLVHTGLGNTIIGNYQGLSDEQLEHWQQIFDSALPTVKVHHNIQQPLLLKLAINCVINPLTAINQCKNGELFNSNFQPQIDKLIAELQQVISKLDNHWPHDEISLKKMIMTVARATADNYSSMAQDVKYQRPTEIEFINGYLILCAKKLNIDVKNNVEVLQRVKQLS